MPRICSLFLAASVVTMMTLASFAAATSVQVDALAGASSSSGNQAVLARRARVGLLPSLGDVKKKALKKMEGEILDAIGTLGNTAEMGDVMRRGYLQVADSMNNAASEAGQWATDIVNSQVVPLVADVDGIKTSMQKELATVRHAVDTAKKGLVEMINTMTEWLKESLTITIPANCQLPKVFVEANQLMHDYAGVTDFIPKDTWCYFVGILAVFESKAADPINSMPDITTTASSLIEELHAIPTIRTTSFMEMIATDSAQLNGAGYNCAAMLHTARAMDAVAIMGNLYLGAIDTNAKDVTDKKSQQNMAFYTAMGMRTVSIVMRAMCAAVQSFKCPA